MNYRQSKRPLVQTENCELCTKTRSVVRPPYVEQPLCDGDSLQSLAIRYRCTVEELKRLNHIHNENEIFAKTMIRLPRHTTLPGVHNSGSNSPSIQIDSTSNFNPTTLRSTLTKQVLSGDTSNSINNIVFNSNYQSNSLVNDNDLDDSIVPETSDQIRLIPEHETIRSSNCNGSTPLQKLNCNGTDGGITLFHICVCLGLIVLIPLIIVIYIVVWHKK